jgi:hypothetical protein
MTLPIDRTTLAAAQGNQVPSAVASSTKNINALKVLFDTMDELNEKVNAHAQSATLAHPDGSVKTAKIANLAVTAEKIASLPANIVGASQIIDLSITNAEIANGTLTADKFVPGALTNDTQNGLRITSLEESTSKYYAQDDFVSFIQGFRSYDRMRFKKIPQTTPKYQVCLDDGNKHITYQFIKDVNDDFWKIDNCFVGELGESFYQKTDATDRTGTWVTGFPPVFYTTEVGATFTCHVKGGTLVFYHRTINNGGIWSIVVDGGSPVTVSCYADIDTPINSTVIATGLDLNTTHTIVGTFAGADPAHAPSGGTARGWLHFQPASDDIGSVVGLDPSGNPITSVLLDYYSNKEIAIQITKDAVTNFVPDHGVGVIANIDNTKFILDSSEKDVASITEPLWFDCNDFKILQHVHVFFPGKGNLAEMNFTHHIDTRGAIDYWGNIKALQTFRADEMYPLMLPMSSDLNEMYTSVRSRKVNDADDSNYYPTDSSLLKSAVCISSSNPNYVAAGTVLFPSVTMRVGEIGSPQYPIRFWQRASIPKLYWTSGRTVDFGVGDEYSWGGKIGIAEIDNIYKFFN